MRFHESPNIPFTIIYEKSKQGMWPDCTCCMMQAVSVYFCSSTTIIYDNACNLHNYCLNREAHHFKRSRFFFDRFHWRKFVV